MMGVLLVDGLVVKIGNPFAVLWQFFGAGCQQLPCVVIIGVCLTNRKSTNG
jgi:hypothetical protein